MKLYPQENKSVLKRLLGLLICIRDFIRSKAGENELVKAVSDILFKFKLETDLLDPKLKKNKSPDDVKGIVGPSKRDLLMKSVVIHIIQNAESLAAFLEDQSPPSLFGGETILLRFNRVRRNDIWLTLWITNYRIFFVNPESQSKYEVPVMSINHVKSIVDSSAKKATTYYKCSLTTKDYITINLEFENVLSCDHFVSHIKTIIHPKKFTDIFAFQYKPKAEKEQNLINGWDVYSQIDEFDRQKAFDIKLYTGTKMWRITNINASYDIPTYPSTLLVPYSMNDTDIKKIMNIRIRNRFPILSYAYKRNKGTGMLIRCDEPDLTQLGDIKDSKLVTKQFSDVKYIERLGALSNSICVIDAGCKKTYAMSYAQFHIQFLDLMSNSEIKDQLSLIQLRFEKYTQTELENDKIYRAWTDMVMKILLNAAKISKLIEDRSCVIITHSMSHDIDYILSSLAQLFLDGYYRTLIGFQVLIEKDWCNYGYEFAIKVGHGCDIEDQDICSPCFQLFLECVYVLINQYPLHFEFNEAFLLGIMDSLYSCQYGTFLCNNSREREVLKEKTQSLWTDMNSKSSEYTNSFYESDTYDLSIYPYIDSERINIWPAIHLRASEHCENLFKKMSEIPTHEEIINLSGSSISFAPQEISQKSMTKRLNLSNNTLRTFPLSVLPLTNIIQLDLSRNPLKLISSDIFYIIATRMTLLQDLNISKTGLSILPEEIGYCKSLRILRLSNNLIKELPEKMSKLQNLEILDARMNRITKIDRLLSHWKNLRVLAIGGNQIETLQVYDNKKLHIIDISVNRLLTPPDDLQKVGKVLNTLFMDHNKIEKLPSSIGKLENLSLLSLCQCSLSSIPRDISLLKNLTSLHASHNNLKKLHSRLFNLTNLKHLDVSYNSIAEIPENITSLRSLESLDLTSNRISFIPTKLPLSLLALKTLKLAHNNISNIDNMVGIWHMTNLENLYLRNNAFKYIPRTLGLLASSLRILDVDMENILFPPPVILKKGVTPSLRYMSDQLNGKIEERRVNILVLGAKGSGRSTITQSLLQKSNSVRIELQSDIIDTFEWNFSTGNRRSEIKEINAMVWDFDYCGELETGQIVHNLFLTERGVYIVVWNVTTPIETIDPWLNLIKSKLPKGNIIIACTFLEDNPNITKSTIEDIETKYKKRHPFIKKMVVAYNSSKSFKELKSTVMNVVNDIPWIGQLKPSVFEVFEKMLIAESPRLNPPFVTWDGFKKIAELCCISDDQTLEDAAKFLKDVGVVYYHKDNPVLKDFVLLDRVYPITFIQQFMKDETHLISDGLLYHDNLSKMDTKIFPPSSHKYLLALMEQLQFSFRVQNNRRNGHVHRCDESYPDRSIIPILLPTEMPSTVDDIWNNSPGYLFGRIYKMKYVPLNFLSIIQSKVQSFLDDVISWKNGIFIESKDTGELIKIYTNLIKNRVTMEVKTTDKCSLSRALVEIIDCTRRIINHSASVHIICYTNGTYKESDVIPLLDCEKAMLKGTHVNISETEIVDPEALAPNSSVRILGVNVIPWLDLTVDSKIGDGSTAEVFVAKYNDRNVAVKKLRATSQDEKAQGFISDSSIEISKAFAEFRREVRYMSLMKHPSILGFEGVVLNPLSIVLEYCPGGSLYDFVHYPKHTMTWDLRLKIIYDLSRGICVMHAHTPPIVHRDLKSPNIMVVDFGDDWEQFDSIVKVSDFGLTGIIPEIGGREVDNPIWLAPEIMKRIDYDEKSDVYSFGVIMYEVLTSKQFFDEITFMTDLEALILAGERPEIPDNEAFFVVPEYIELMKECWRGNPNERPTVFEINQRLKEIIVKYAPNLKVVDEDFEQSLVKIIDLPVVEHFNKNEENANET